MWCRPETLVSARWGFPFLSSSAWCSLWTHRGPRTWHASPCLRVGGGVISESPAFIPLRRMSTHCSADGVLRESGFVPDYARGPQVSCYRTADDFINELREQGSVVVHCPPGCLGMFEGNVYGSNPYWVHSSICPAAIHAGVVTRDGGKVCRLLSWVLGPHAH